MNRFNKLLNETRIEVIKIRSMESDLESMNHVTEADSIAIVNEYAHLHAKMEEGSVELNDAYMVSYISLLFPIKMILYMYFLKATKRTTDLILDPTHIIEFCLFVAEFIWIFDYSRLVVYDPTNIWAVGDEGDHHNLMLNVIWY